MSAKKVSNLPASVRTRLFNEAEARHRPFNEVLQHYAMERFLFRLAATPHSKRLMLKGALMLPRSTPRPVTPNDGYRPARKALERPRRSEGRR